MSLVFIADISRICKQVTCTHLRWVEFKFENFNFLKILFILDEKK